MRECRHFLVSGRVQGVFYRAGCQQKARELELTGWVRNRADGTVEAVACGEEAQLQAFERWLWEGPERATVTGIIVNTETLSDFPGFDVR